MTVFSAKYLHISIQEKPPLINLKGDLFASLLCFIDFSSSMVTIIPSIFFLMS